MNYLENLRKNQNINDINNQIDEVRERHNDVESIGVKKSILNIVLGVVSLGAMTCFDMLIHHYHLEGLIKGVFTFGYFITALFSFLILYGIFELIKVIFAKR